MIDDKGNAAPHIARVLDVPSGQLCYVIGTVYVDMPLKKNVLDDIATEVSCNTVIFQC